MKLLKFYFRYFVFRSLRKTKNIEGVIRSHGFQIFTYRLEAQNDPITRMIEQMGATEYAKHHICFIATSEILKCVFIKHNLNDDDQLELLFHEEAHIWYNHPNTTGFTEETDTQQERIANHFLLKLRILKAITTALALILLIAGIFFLFFRLSNSVAVSASSVETVQHADELPAQMKAEPDPDDLVWLTAYGDAYHRKICGTITGKEITQVTRADAESLGRHSCSYCNP